MSNKIKIIALDLDGTLLNQQNLISERNRQAIRRCIDEGIHVIISSGRPYIGLPLAEMDALGIKYAITTNGSALYEVPSRKCLYENAIPTKRSIELLHDIYQYPLHLDAFINGNAYSQASTRQYVSRLQFNDAMKKYILNSRNVIDDIAGFVAENKYQIQKLTLNFMKDDDGTLISRNDIVALLSRYPDLHYVSGGFDNLEINNASISKAKGLAFFSEYLNVPIEDTMACGDSENDLDMVRAAGVGVAMANSEQLLLDCADYVTRSNIEDGVAYAIEHFVFEEC